MPTRKEARALLRDAGRNIKNWIGAKSSGFVFGPLDAAIRTLDRPDAPRSDLRLAANGHAFKGDLFDYIDAPRAAARAYRAAVRCEPGDAWSWAELGNMLNSVGHYRAALRALRKAQALGDDSSLLGHYFEHSSEGIRDRDGWCLYPHGLHSQKPAPSWEAHELLARNRPRDVLRLLRRCRHPYLRQLRARACAALGDVPRYFDEWSGIARTGRVVAFDLADWIFLPSNARDLPRFWRMLHGIRDRLGYGWSYTHEALERIVPHPRRRRSGVRDLRRHRRRLGLWFRYEIARTERDATRAMRLARRYPEWPEAVRLARRLSR